MKKVLLQGRDTSFSNQLNIADIYKENEINKYLESSHLPEQIYINAHGGEYFQANLPSQLSLSLFNV